MTENERKLLDSIITDVRADPNMAAAVVKAEMSGRGVLAPFTVGEVTTTALEVLLEQHHRLQGLMD